jgi:hypothetical protein
MKRTAILTLSILFLILTTTCKKQKSCPGFNISKFTEFCYQQPVTLTFESQEQEQFIVTISSIFQSLPYNYECRDLYGICPCLNSVEAKATDSQTTTEYSFAKMELSDVSEMQYFKFNVKGFEFEFDFINELPHIDQMDNFSFYPTITIGNQIYSEVVVVTNQNQDQSGISQVFFSKQFGVLRFTEKVSGKVWSILN